VKRRSRFSDLNSSRIQGRIVHAAFWKSCSDGSPDRPKQHLLVELAEMFTSWKMVRRVVKQTGSQKYSLARKRTAAAAFHNPIVVSVQKKVLA